VSTSSNPSSRSRASTRICTSSTRTSGSTPTRRNSAAPLIQCQIRLRTNEGQVGGSGEGYGAEHAFHVALDKLERNVLEIKGVNADEEYRGQLLRKLGEL